MPSEIRSPRTLANWLELDYHRRRKLLPGWGWWLLGGLLLGVVSLVGLYAAQGHKAFQAGPVSRPHALFNGDCGKCHTSNGTTLTRLWYGDRVGSVDDEACKKCHVGAEHNQHAGPVGRCVECHKEHRGHEMLERLPDATCVRCHGDLKAVYADAKRAPRVTRFDLDHHPPFAKKEKGDPGTVAFNHAVHLVQSGVLEAARGPDGQPVFKRLSCSDCHIADVDGKYMRPISYEQHCKSCHPLGANLVDDFRDPARLHQADAFRSFFLGRIDHPRAGQEPAEMPQTDQERLQRQKEEDERHRRGVAGVRASIRDALTRFILDPRNQGFLGGEAPPPRPLPDRDHEAVTRPAFEWVNRQRGEVERVLFDGPGGCRYCHEKMQPRKADELPVVPPPGILNRWWLEASFTHEPHRMVNCVACHPTEKSTRTADVLLPDQASCVRCHKPDGAGTHCVDCHVYHDPVLQRAGRPKRVVDIDWLLRR
jgi:hypothetical protein